MSLFSLTHRHLKALLLTVAVLFAAGLYAASTLPVGLFPNVSFPRIVVGANAGDMPADQMMVKVSRPLEDAISSVPGIARVRSTTSRGSCDLAASFGWTTDMKQTLLLVRTAMEQARPTLPPGTEITVRQMDPTTFPMAGYSLTSKTRSQAELRELAIHTFRPLLMSVPGVARVGLLGGDEREFQVTLDPVKLQSRGLSSQAVTDAIARHIVIESGGLMESNYQLFLTLVDGRTATPAAIAAIPVTTSKTGQPVLVRDLGAVAESTAPRWKRFTANGLDAVLINVYQTPAGNTVSIDQGIKDVLEKARNQLPPDVAFGQFYHQAGLISEAMDSVRDSILVGIALGVLVIWLFLRKAKLTLLAAVAVPASLGLTILVLQAFHQTFNVMTLGGLAAAVGLVLDDAIVMIENVARHLKRGQGTMAAAATASNELRIPFIGSSLCSIVVFMPLAFLTGVSGAFFRSLSLTMAAALVISLILTLVVLPPLAAHVLSAKDAEHEEGHPGRVDSAYRGLMGWLLPRPWIVVGAGGLMVLGTVGFYMNLPNGFLPEMDEGAFVLNFETPPGTSLAETERINGQIDRILATTPEVTNTSRRTGAENGESLMEPNQGDFVVMLKHKRQRGADAIMADIRSRIQMGVPGVRTEFAHIMEDRIGDLTAVPQPVEIKLFGTGQEETQAAAVKVAGLIGRVPGVVDVYNGIRVSGPSRRAIIDPLAVGRFGVSPTDALSAVTAAITGQVADNILRGDELLNVRVKLARPAGASEPDLDNVPVPLLNGAGVVPLSTVARIVDDPGETQIVRENFRQMVAVTARIEGQSLGGTVDRIRTLLKQELKLPSGMSLEFGGLYEEQQQSFRGLLMVLGAGFMLVFLVLTYEFGKFGVPLAILAVDVMSLFGVMLALFLSGTPLNISSLMGAVMIVGIVAENAVFFIHYVHEYRESGLTLDEALVEAGRVRTLPVIMTTLAAILALLPLALGLGAGAELQRPLAIAVIGGFALSSFLILVALPVLYRALVRGDQGPDPEGAEQRHVPSAGEPVY